MYVILLILLILFGKDGLVSSFENIVVTLLLSYFYGKLLLGMFEYTKFYYYKDNLGKELSEKDIKDTNNINILEQLIRISLSVFNCISLFFCFSL